MNRIMYRLERDEVKGVVLRKRRERKGGGGGRSKRSLALNSDDRAREICQGENFRRVEVV